jgi:predicted metal-dependent enzyme (double-stranded beta helix superfamily)
MPRSTRRAFLVSSATLAAANSCRATRKSSLDSSPRSDGAQEELDVQEFIEDVKRANAEGGQPAVHELLERTVSDPRSVVLGIGEPREAGIHPVYRSAEFTILNVVWAPLMILLPHEHRMWATIGIYGGREDNILWERTGSLVEASGASSLSEKEVFSLPDDVVHSVTNPIERLTGAIHIYGGDFFAVARSEWDAETLREQPCDIQRVMRLFQEANRRFEAGKTGGG